MYKNDFEKRFNRTRKIVNIGFGIGVVLWIVGVSAMVYAGYQVFDAVQTHGLKSLVETVWEGQK